jgi:hypothetical protein
VDVPGPALLLVLFAAPVVPSPVLPAVVPGALQPLAARVLVAPASVGAPVGLTVSAVLLRVGALVQPTKPRAAQPSTARKEAGREVMSM